MTARLFFRESERELPSLRRGWRTPDPSPTRDAAGLPGCRIKLGIAEPNVEDDSSRGSSTAATTCWTSRTPSPPVTRQEFVAKQVPSRVRWDDIPVEEDMPTPRMQTSYSSPPPCLPSKSLNTNFNVEVPEDGLQANTSMMPPGFFWGQQFVVPMPQGANYQETYAWAGDMAGENMMRQEQETCGEYFAPSAGSIGHPFTCAEPCKYVRKKNRGCKDGAVCNRCHLCEWKKKR
mmetsp:Transcript_155550/g.270616  ORF Transcript_155550/g.270616 Transcript_155550/m.270616 type:complete len:233 (-) Transcript_155550:144-842(-)